MNKREEKGRLGGGGAGGWGLFKGRRARSLELVTSSLHPPLCVGTRIYTKRKVGAHYDIEKPRMALRCVTMSPRCCSIVPSPSPERAPLTFDERRGGQRA